MTASKFSPLLCLLLLVLALPLPAQSPQPGELALEAAQFDRWFEEASAEFDVPVRVLQAVAFTESRWRHLAPEPEFEEFDVEGGRVLRAGRIDHQAPPPAFGVMGLRDDSHFGYSLREAALLIGRTPHELKDSPLLNIRGAAALLHKLSGGATRNTPLEDWEDAVALYSGIPQQRVSQMYTYDVFNAILSGRASERYRIAQEEISLARIYGEDMLRILSAPRLTIDVSSSGEAGGLQAGGLSADYGPALWDPAPTCNYGAGRAATITHIAEHIAQGSYAGTISWFKNCNASVSAHYVVRSSDGQVTQMVRESDTAWHVASHNSYSVGIEHEGFASDCAWYTTAMYNGSSLLTRDIANSHGILRTGTYDASLGWDTELPRDSEWKIKGHTNFPTTKTCPGACWDWPRFRSLVIGWSQIVDNASTRFTASANWGTSSFSAQRYGTDYRFANPQAVNDAAWFKFNVPATANYEVYAWYPANSGYNDSTPYVIVTSSGNVNVSVNQRVNGGTWVSLGVFHLSAGDANKVGVSRWTSGVGYVIADAVKLEAR